MNESTYNKLVESVIDLRRQQFRVQGKNLKRLDYTLEQTAEFLDVSQRYLVQIGVFPAPEVVDAT